MARVLILSLVFPPDGVSTAQLMGELAEDLRDSGHEVSVITTQPHYNRDVVAEASQPLRSRWPGLLYESDFRGIRVLHTRMPSRRGGIVQRLRGWLGFHLVGLIAGLREIPRPDVIVVPSPLLTAGIVAWLLGKARRARFIYNVQELYPDLAIQMGTLRNPLVIRGMFAVERAVYAGAAATVGISASICERIVAKGVAPAKVHHIPNFVDVDELVPLARDNAFARDHDLVDAFVVSYAGNFGVAQGLEQLVDAAELTVDSPQLRYVLIGDGVLREKLEASLRTRQVRNVRLIGHQPYARVPEIYAASDLCLVPLLADLGASALPSKVFRIMACGRPIVAICNADSELAELVRASNAGVVVEPGDPGGLARAVRELVADPARRAAMGEAGRRFVEDHFSRPAITHRFSTLIQEIAG